MNEVEYFISTYPSKFGGYQSKKGKKGFVKAYVSKIWNYVVKWNMDDDLFQFFVDSLCAMLIHERFCLERAFQKIRIKGGMCEPCCVRNLAENAVEYLFGLTYEGD